MSKIKPTIFHYAYLLKDKPRKNDTYFVMLKPMCGQCFNHFPYSDDEWSFWSLEIGDRKYKKFCPYCGNEYDWSDWIERITEQIKNEESRGNDVTNKKYLWLDGKEQTNEQTL